MSPALALAALAALGSAAAPSGPQRPSPLETSTPRAAHRRGAADVAYVTATRAYLDAGTSEGLTAGEVVTFRRRGDVIGRCTVDEAADHVASCPATRLRPGDDATFQAGETAPEPKTLPALVADEDLERRAATLAAAPPLPPVVHAVAPGTRPAGPSARTAEVGLSAYAWASTAGGTDQGVARVDVALRGAPVGAGLTVDLDARAERWAPDAEGLGEGGQTRVHVWQAQLNAPLRAVSLSAGRLRSFGALGATIVDGASAAFTAGPARLGAFGGLVPAPDTLTPGTERATAGGWWSLGKVLQGGGQVSTDGRVAWVRTPELGTRVEASVAGRAWLKTFDVSAEAAFGAGSPEDAPGKLDLARLDATWRPWTAFAVGGGVRHQALAWPDRLQEPAVYPGRGDAADGFLSLDAWRYLRLRLVGGWARDEDSSLDRGWAGPELAMLRMFGSRVDAVAGFLEERGWLDGRSAYLQVAWRAGEAFRLTVRGTWAHESSLGLYADEVGLMLSASAALAKHVGLRMAVLTHVPTQFSEESAPPVGYSGNLAVVATY
jgi:hypothetical protein